jgi:hypothetical protein
MSTPSPEAWQRGPVPGYEPLLMPVAHALMQAREDLEGLAREVPAAHTWRRPGGAASIGFHVRHAGGAQFVNLRSSNGFPVLSFTLTGTSISSVSTRITSSLGVGLVI